MVQASFQQNQEAKHSFHESTKPSKQPSSTATQPASKPAEQPASDQSMKIYEMRRKSTEDKKPAWNQAEVFIGAAARALRLVAKAQSPRLWNP